MAPKRKTSKSTAKNLRRRYGIFGIVTIVALGAAYGIVEAARGDATPRKRIVETVVLKLVPPPPPPKVEPPPPPPKLVEQKIQPPVDKPEDKPKDEPPPPGPLALDAKAGPGSDSFGLGGKQGGADFLGGGGGTRFGHYAHVMQNEINQCLQKDDKLDFGNFGGTVKIKVSDSGKVAHVDILHTTGNPETDERIRQVLVANCVMSEAPPSPDMPTAIVHIGARPTNQT